jgi:hypothetical protein
MAEARLQLARRFAACAVLAEGMEARMARGEELDLSEYSTLTSTMVRVAQRIGINRTARDITPDPLIYARDYARRKAEEVAA